MSLVPGEGGGEGGIEKEKRMFEARWKKLCAGNKLAIFEALK